MTSKTEPGMSFYVALWTGLMVIVGIEVLLTYQHPAPKTLLLSFLCLSFLEAAIASLYMMHLRYEDPGLFWYLIPMMLFCIVLLNYLWPDAFRIVRMGTFE